MTDQPNANLKEDGGERAKCSRHGLQRFFDCPECFQLEMGKHATPAALKEPTEKTTELRGAVALAQARADEKGEAFVVYELNTSNPERYAIEPASDPVPISWRSVQYVKPKSLEVGGTEVESIEPTAPPPDAAPLALSIEDDDAEPRRGEDEGEALAATEGASKKEQIISLFESGTRDISEIVKRVKARPSYVAQVLQQAGHLDGFFDLYQTTGREQNVYTRYFRNVLHFRNVEAARESVARIDRLYNYFERLGDRAGQHQATILALTGKNRARWSGKLEESEIFSEWLNAH